ncbi:rfbP protein [Vibrio cholerae]|nr:rfbP protein [Vibrio cholerae]TRN17273.1 rfbP protein [Vibrio cholerae]
MTTSRFSIVIDEKSRGFRGFFIVIPKPPLLAVVIVPRGFCPKMRPC